jgi:hypothetical protein
MKHSLRQAQATRRQSRRSRRASSKRPARTCKRPGRWSGRKGPLCHCRDKVEAAQRARHAHARQRALGYKASGPNRGLAGRILRDAPIDVFVIVLSSRGGPTIACRMVANIAPFGCLPSQPEQSRLSACRAQHRARDGELAASSIRILPASDRHLSGWLGKRRARTWDSIGVGTAGPHLILGLTPPRQDRTMRDD